MFRVVNKCGAFTHLYRNYCSNELVVQVKEANNKRDANKLDELVKQAKSQRVFFGNESIYSISIDGYLKTKKYNTAIDLIEESIKQSENNEAFLVSAYSHTIKHLGSVKRVSDVIKIIHAMKNSNIKLNDEIIEEIVTICSETKRFELIDLLFSTLQQQKHPIRDETIQRIIELYTTSYKFNDFAYLYFAIKQTGTIPSESICFSLISTLYNVKQLITLEIIAQDIIKDQNRETNRLKDVVTSSRKRLQTVDKKLIWQQKLTVLEQTRSFDELYQSVTFIIANNQNLNFSLSETLISSLFQYLESIHDLKNALALFQLVKSQKIKFNEQDAIVCVVDCFIHSEDLQINDLNQFLKNEISKLHDQSKQKVLNFILPLNDISSIVTVLQSIKSNYALPKETTTSILDIALKTNNLSLFSMLKGGHHTLPDAEYFSSHFSNAIKAKNWPVLFSIYDLIGNQILENSPDNVIALLNACKEVENTTLLSQIVQEFVLATEKLHVQISSKLLNELIDYMCTHGLANVGISLYYYSFDYQIQLDTNSFYKIMLFRKENQLFTQIESLFRKMQELQISVSPEIFELIAEIRLQHSDETTTTTANKHSIKLEHKKAENLDNLTKLCLDVMREGKQPAENTLKSLTDILIQKEHFDKLDELVQLAHQHNLFLDFSAYIALIKNTQDPEVAFQTFQKIIGRKQIVVPDDEVFAVLLEKLGDKSCVEKLDAIVKEILTRNMDLKETTSTALISSLRKDAQHLDLIQKLVFYLIAKNEIPSLTNHMEPILEQLFQAGNYQAIDKIYMKIIASNLDHVLSFNATKFCLFALMKSEQADQRVKPVFQKLTESGFVPDEETYRELIRFYSQLKQVGDMRNMFDEARAKKVSFSVNDYNVLIEGYSKAKQTDKVMFLLDLMKEFEIAYNEGTYSALIEVYANAKQGDKVKEYVFEMVNAGYKPNENIISAFVNSVGGNQNQQMNKLRDLFTLMKEKGFSPDVHMYNAIIDVHGKNKSVERMASVFALMKEEGVTPDMNTFNSMIRHSVRLQSADTIVQMAAEMKALNLSMSKELLVPVGTFLSSKPKYKSKLAEIVEMMK